MKSLSRRDNFRGSKTAHKEIIEGREFYFHYPKSNRGIVSVYDTLTGYLILVSVKDIETTREWLISNFNKFRELIVDYEVKDEYSLF